MESELKNKINTALADPSVSDEVKAILTEARDKLDDKLSKKEKFEIMIKIASIFTNAASFFFDK